jgi:hypothetical protein
VLRWLHNNFDVCELGFYVWKNFGWWYEPPLYWDLEEGNFITETVDDDVNHACGRGINFGDESWFITLPGCSEKLSKINQYGLWLCVLHWEDVKDVVLPRYGIVKEHGKARCARLQLMIELAEPNVECGIPANYTHPYFVNKKAM